MVTVTERMSIDELLEKAGYDKYKVVEAYLRDERNHNEIFLRRDNRNYPGQFIIEYTIDKGER